MSESVERMLFFVVIVGNEKSVASKCSPALLFLGQAPRHNGLGLHGNCARQRTAAATLGATRKRERSGDDHLSLNSSSKLTVHALAVGLHQLLQLRRPLGLELDQGSVLSSCEVVWA